MCISATKSSRWRLFGRRRLRSARTRKIWTPTADAARRAGESGRRSRAADSEHRAFDHAGRILRDNIYGTIEEDVWRRDFAANGLYYNIEDFSIWDFVDGVSDVRARRLKLIGDPETRYREDPVRMLRAVRFAAKLDFSIEPKEPSGRSERLRTCWTACRRRGCSMSA